MISTVGVELTNFINPDLTWKTVSKGSRRGTRRTRKPISRKLSIEVKQGSKNATASVDATVSESKKVGVAILGRRFSEKIEHVPIKKRRIGYFSSSPPPPQTPSPHPEFSEPHAHDQSTSDESLFNSSWRQGLSKVGDVVESIAVNDRNFLNMMGEKCDNVEDFSGMEILAAAACSDSVGHDAVQSKSNSLMAESNQEHTDSLISETLVDRSLWDLNLTMDAWEKPCACNDGGSEKNSDEDISSDRSRDILVAEPKDIIINSTVMIGSTTVDGTCVRSAVLCAGIDGLDGERNEVKEFSVPKRIKDESVLVTSDKVEESVKFNAGCADALTEIGKVDQCRDQCRPPQSDDVPIHDTNDEDCGDAGQFDMKPSVQEHNFQPVDVTVEVKPGSKVEGMEICHASLKCDFSNIASPGALKDAAGEIVQASPAHPAEIVYSKTGVHDESFLKSHENMIDATGSGGFATREESRGKLDKVSVDVNQSAAASQNTVIAGGMGDSLELQAGYDSQFEDGELRESDVQCWEDIEQVDYDTECEDERLSGIESDICENKLNMERESNATSVDRVVSNNDGNVEGASTNSKMKNGNVADSNRIKVDTISGADGFSARNSHFRLNGSKASSDGVRKSRSSNFDDSFHRAEKDGHSDRFMERDRAAPRLHGRSPGDGCIFNRSTVYWNSKQQRSPVYQGPYNPVRLRPRSVVERHEYVMATDRELSEAAGVARTGHRISRQFLSSSNGVYRPHTRRSPVARDDSYGMPTRMATPRDLNHDRSMFRRYPQNGSRASRDEYLKHISDSTEYFGRMTHRLGRRERSGSPNGGRPHYPPYRSSRSRSRSRSPIPWLPQRDRSEGSRRRIRSPNFKSDATRMDRERLMFPKRFGSDCKEGFMPAARRRISPQHDGRLFEDRNTDFDRHLRSRKSPVRMFRQSQRFETMRSSRRLDTDEHFRPMTRPRRYPDMAAGGKGCKYEGGEDNKYGGIYDTNHRGRQYETDGTARQFQYNEDLIVDDEC